MAKAKRFDKVKSLIKAPFVYIFKVLKKLTAPIRSNKAYKRARNTFLKSPFNGYFKDSYAELKLVQWPDWKTSWKLTGTVIVFSVAFAIFTTFLDIGFEKIAKKIFLN